MLYKLKYQRVINYSVNTNYIYDTICFREIWKIIRLLNDKIVSLHLQ